MYDVDMSPPVHTVGGEAMDLFHGLTRVQLGPYRSVFLSNQRKIYELNTPYHNKNVKYMSIDK